MFLPSLRRVVDAHELQHCNHPPIGPRLRRPEPVLRLDCRHRWEQLIVPARRALSPGKTLVIFGGQGGGGWFGGLDRQLRAHLVSPLASHKLGTFVARESAQDLIVLNEFIESECAPVIDRTYPMSEAAEALRHLEAGHARCESPSPFEEGVVATRLRLPPRRRLSVVPTQPLVHSGTHMT